MCFAENLSKANSTLARIFDNCYSLPSISNLSFANNDNNFLALIAKTENSVAKWARNCEGVVLQTVGGVKTLE